MKAIVQVLYREVEGAGDDTESNTPDGVVVTLTKWQTASTDWRARNHYMIEKTAMVDRDYVVHTYKIETLGATEAEMIREAIKAFDELVANHPAFGMAVQS